MIIRYVVSLYVLVGPLDANIKFLITSNMVNMYLRKVRAMHMANAPGAPTAAPFSPGSPDPGVGWTWATFVDWPMREKNCKFNQLYIICIDL